jgi:hypothetical protein
MPRTPSTRYLMTRYEEMITKPQELIEEARRLGQPPHVKNDPELSIFLGLLVGKLANLEDRVRRLSVLCRIHMN